MERIYADYNATCPCTPEHYEQVIEKLKEVDSNPSSIHYFGRKAKVALEESRKAVANLIGARHQELLFNSGATESNNSILKGVVYKKISDGGEKPHIVISAAEHSSVRATATALEAAGLCELSVVPVTPIGVVDTEALRKAIKSNTVLVALIYVNNEVGSINPVEEISEMVKSIDEKIHFHTDAVQALGKLDTSWIGKSKVDSASISAHKVGGFKGVGALFLKAGVKINALLDGGGQERRRRSGTENIPGIVSFGLRADEISNNPRWLDHTVPLHKSLIERLRTVKGATIHGDPDKLARSTVSFHIDGVKGEDLMVNFDLKGIAVSAGSACSSGVARPSAVISAMGYDDWAASNTIRISFGPDSTMEHIDKMLQVIESMV